MISLFAVIAVAAGLLVEGAGPILLGLAGEDSTVGGSMVLDSVMLAGSGDVTLSGEVRIGSAIVRLCLGCCN
jgi:hypothetical protein